MIVVKLIGGLGNQLFQYAIAKKLAIQFNTEVVLDTMPFEKYKLHKYSLEHFNFNKHIATISDLSLLGLEQGNIIQKNYYRILRKIIKPVIISEKQFNFDNDIFLKAKKHTYLDGYWQTEKYFSDIRSILLADLIIKKPLENKNLEIANQINAVNSVSLHIRRADYVSNTDTLNIHGVCGLDYYFKAIEHISKEVEKPVLFIFSDDMQWVKENLQTSLDTVYVDHNNADTNYEDLRLMSFCKNNIIANSSFSWWGAWLNNHDDKIVIAPKKWFSTNERNYSDVIPSKWMQL